MPKGGDQSFVNERTRLKITADGDIPMGLLFHFFILFCILKYCLISKKSLIISSVEQVLL